MVDVLLWVIHTRLQNMSNTIQAPKIGESEASRRGVTYRNADGSPLPDKCEFDVTMQILPLGEFTETDCDVLLGKHEEN